jgi:hypothetical protein
VTDYDIDDGLPTSVLGSLVWFVALSALVAAWVVLVPFRRLVVR